MTAREGKIWSGAIIVSLGLHLALFIPRATVLSAADGNMQQPAAVTRVSFRTLAQPRPVAKEPAVVPTPKPRVPKPVVPRPIAAQAPAVPIEMIPPVETGEMHEVESLVETTQVIAAVVDQNLVDQIRREYLGQLLAHIEERKFYPPAARRRGLQGVIQVSFMLHDSGQISEVMLADGHAVLQQAAEQAVRAALPLPAPPDEVVCPLRVSFGMEYKLN